MAATKTTTKTATRTTKTSKPKAPKPPAKGPPRPPSMSLAEVMKTLEKAGSAQTRKTYARHGASEPMFGVSFATLKVLVKRIGADHDLARALWETGNFDARNLALKVADPARVTSAELDRWARDTSVRMVSWYIPMLAAESPLGPAKAKEWLAAPPGPERCEGWGLAGQLAQRDVSIPDSWFAGLVAEIERSIHGAPNAEREGMNGALIAIGGRSAALRKAALAAAKRIGTVEVDHGDTACKTPDAGAYIEKMWAHAKTKGFESPAAQEREREFPRNRC